MLAILFLTAAFGTGGAEPDTTLRLPRGGAVAIESHTGNVTLRSGAGDAVTVRGGTVEFDGHDLSITADAFAGDRSASLDITLPVWAAVTVHTLSGDIVVEGAPERLQAETFKGAIRVLGGGGRLELESVAGAITVTDFRGSRLTVDATGNDITITNATGRLELTSVNGAIRMRGIRSSFVDVNTVDGLIEFEGPLASDGRYNFETHSGGLTLTLPGDVSAHLDISTFSGRFQSQIPATRPADSDHSDSTAFTARLGRGEARVTIDSFSGNIRVLRGGRR